MTAASALSARALRAACVVVVAAVVAFIGSGCVGVDHVLVDDDHGGVVVDEAVVARAKADTVALRGLPFQRDVPLEVLSVRELEEWLNRYYDDYKEALRRQDYFYHKMGILPPARDSASTWKGFLGDFAGGVYDDDRVAADGTKGTMILVRDYAWWSKVQLDMIGVMNGVDLAYETFLAHELTHALQDQHFELSRLLDNVADDDTRMVQKIVLESEANVVGMAHFAGMRLDTLAQRKAFFAFLRYNNFFNAPMLAALAGKTPSFFSRQTFAQYELGLDWVEARLDDGEWKARVDGVGHGAQAELALAYARVPGSVGALPASTEQLLFADKAHDPPRHLPRLPLDDAGRFAALGDAVHVDSDVFGALALKHWLEGPLSSAAEVARGWGGDRYDVFVDDDDSPILLWRFIADSPGDADEIAHALEERLRRSLGDEGRLAAASSSSSTSSLSSPLRVRAHIMPAPEERRAVRTTRPEWLAIEVRGDKVVVVNGVDVATDIDAVVDALFAVTADAPAMQTSTAQATAAQELQARVEEAVALVTPPPPSTPLAARIVAPHRQMVLRLGVRQSARFAAGEESSPYQVLDIEGRWGVRDHIELSLPAAVTFHTAVPSSSSSSSSSSSPFVLALSVAPGSLPFGEPLAGTWSGRFVGTAAWTSATLAVLGQVAADASFAALPSSSSSSSSMPSPTVTPAALMAPIDGVPSLVFAPGVSFTRAAAGDVVTFGSAWQRGFVAAPLVELEVVPGLDAYAVGSVDVEVARARFASPEVVGVDVGGGLLCAF